VVDGPVVDGPVVDGPVFDGPVVGWPVVGSIGTGSYAPRLDADRPNTDSREKIDGLDPRLHIACPPGGSSWTCQDEEDG
ncbi:MAG TPA: hypothetical protein VHO00_12650, partial [Actinomycetes bacterium]|nr:hypothetical protein [Actinomycetes bacterium]